MRRDLLDNHRLVGDGPLILDPGVGEVWRQDPESCCHVADGLQSLQVLLAKSECCKTGHKQKGNMTLITAVLCILKWKDVHPLTAAPMTPRFKKKNIEWCHRPRLRWWWWHTEWSCESLLSEIRRFLLWALAKLALHLYNDLYHHSTQFLNLLGSCEIKKFPLFRSEPNYKYLRI